MMVDGQAIDLSSVKDALVPPLGMTAFAPNGDPVDVYNHYANFGAEYVYHCHILSHEEMDMMHSVLYAFRRWRRVTSNSPTISTAPER